MKKIANIINFVRSVEPRTEDDGYLFTTLQEELELCKAYGWRSTVLLQFDALIRPEYQALVKEYGGLVEPGLWLEVVEPQAKAAGIPWEGRYVWDWEGGVNYLTHYAPAHRERLLDAAFGTFRDIFGYYPAVVGCWSLDSRSLAYMKDTYDIAAACICRDQYGTDYTTLWGGVYNGGFYPSKNNLLCPAHTKEQQIGVPVFRMLGPDPLYQYDMGLGEPEKPQKVCTLEPVYPEGGGSESWVRWYLKENYNDKCLSHAYAQFGQENSFGWEEIRRGLPMQFRLLQEKVLSGEIELQTLGETGKWYTDTYETTAPVAMCTDSDWKENGYQSVWYASRFYRANLLYQNGTVWFRDLQLFDSAYRPEGLDEASASPETGSFNLPVTDGFRFSKNGVRAGIYVERNGETWRTDKPFESAAEGENAIRVTCGDVSVLFTESEIRLRLPEEANLAFRYADVPWLPYREAEDKTLRLAFRGFGKTAYAYALRLGKGAFRRTENGIFIEPEAGEISFLIG